MQTIPYRFTTREPSAAAIFRAGLPDIRRGRIVTSSSVVDSWRYKSTAIRDRLARERIAHASQAAL